MANTDSKIRLYIAEEQQILREAYGSLFQSQPDMEVVGCSGDTTEDALVGMAASLKPNVMLLCFRILQTATVEKLEMIRESCPGTSIVLLSAHYDSRGIKALKAYLRKASTGYAYLLKHSIDTAEQLVQVVHSVVEGRVMVDPMVMEGLMTSTDSMTAFLKELTTRELEILGWMAKGYRNNTIADLLHLDPKTVEKHINGIYSKLGNHPESQHPRVHAIVLYLKATGQLPADVSEG